MFSNINKPAFGSTAAAPSFGFGSTASSQAPFGQSQLFGKPATTGFGATAPLFGSTSQQSSTPLFSNTTVPSFGGAPQQAGFGTAGIFGQQQTVTGSNGLFTGASTSTFGQQNKTAGFGFGASTTAPLFGQQQAQNFQPSTAGGVFGASAGFGASGQMGTVIKFNPVTGTDTMQKSGITHSISTKHHCITCMKEYEAKSLEELRWEDYQCNRRGAQQQPGFGGTPFGAAVSTTPSLFGQTEAKPAFGQSTGFGASPSGFGMTNQQPQSTLFGKATTGFGATPTTNTFGFNTTPAFGTNAVKPFGAQPTQNVFGPTPTTQSSGFGSNFFSQANTQNTGGFFSKPAQTAFNAQQPVFAFGQQPTNQNTFFQPPKSTATFGTFGQSNLTTSTAFGQPSNIFSQSTPNPFNAFQKPAQPTFGQPLQTGGFTLGSQPPTNTFFGANKPLFGATTQSSFFTPPTGGFMMPPHQQSAQAPSIGYDQQQAADFQNHVAQIYEPFPHYDFLADIAAKPKPHDATNPQAIKEILEQASMPITPIEPNISKYRVMLKRRTGFLGASKYALLDDIVDKSTTHNNYLVRNSTGKRLVLRRTTPRSDKELTELYKNMSSPGGNKGQSLFRNLHELEESSTEKGIPGPTEVSPSMFRNRSQGPIFSSPGSGRQQRTEGTQTATATPKSVLKSKNANFPLIELSSDSDSDTKEDENLVERLPSDDELKARSPEGGARSESFISLTDTDANLTTPRDDSDSIHSPRGTGKKSMKTVRFQDTEISSTSDATDAEDGPTRNESRNVANALHNTSHNNTTNADDSATLSAEEKLVKTCGVKLERPEYYTYPPLLDLHKYKTESGACLIKGFTIGREFYGNIHFPDAIDVSNLDLDDIVHFRYREVTVYPDDDKRPPVGQGLNLRAQVTLENVFPRDSDTRKEIRDVREIIASGFRERLCVLAEKQNAVFVDYRPATGSWVFNVEHFSKYRFSEEDDQECREEMEASRREQEIQQKEHQQKKLEEHQELTTETVKRGLGGVSCEGSNPIETLYMRPHASTRPLNFKDDSRNVIIMKSSFFDEESISDVSSSDVGITQHFTLPTTTDLASRINPNLLPRVKPCVIKHFALRNAQHTSALHRSLFVSRNYMDIGVFKGRSFKVGWAAGFKFTDVCASKVVVYSNLGNLCGRSESMELKKHLQVVYQNSDVTVDPSGMPLFKIKDGSESLVQHQKISNQIPTTNDDAMLKYYSEIWNLCLALWGPGAATPMARAESFSQWLQDTAVSYIWNNIELPLSNNQNVIKDLFVFLTGFQVRRAARLAMDNNLPRLSALIAQLDESTRLMLCAQVSEWKNSGAFNFIDKNLLKLYMLLGGIPVMNDINICEDLDWKRALAIHFWYLSSPQGMSINSAMKAYTDAFTSWNYAKEPTPNHCESNSVVGICDILYHILVLFDAPVTALDKVLNNPTHTEYSLDYRLSWLLRQTLSALKIGYLSEDADNLLNVRFASQLESLGLWNWSVFVLLFIKDNCIKKNEIMAVLERNLNLDRTENLFIEDMLVTDLKIPSEWIHKTLASKAELANKPIDFFKHAALSRNWQEAHSVAVSHIIPELVTGGQFNKLLLLLEDLIPGKERIPFWANSAGLIAEIINIQYKIAETTKTVVGEQGARHLTDSDLIHMKAELSSVCRRVKHFPASCAKHLLAVSEMSRFIAVLLYLVYYELQSDSQKDLNTAMAQLKELVMPPDYFAVEANKYVGQYAKGS